MEYEIELKLITNEHAGKVIETKLLPQLNAKVSKSTLVLTNHYFDTPSRVLRRNDIGLRIRGNDQKFEQTLKTAGQSIGGLHQRPEYNVQLDGSLNQNTERPNLGLFSSSAWPENIDIDELQNQMETLFTTHFERRVYLLEFPSGDVVELVWDLGEVTSGGKSVPICEVELELKKGTIPAIFNVAKQIVGLMPTIIGTDSKAARGYSLCDNLPSKALNQFERTSSKKVLNNPEEFADLLTLQLQHFQSLSNGIRQQHSESLVRNTTFVFSDLMANVELFNQYFPCNVLSDIHKTLVKLFNEWSIVMQLNDENSINSLLDCPQMTELQLNIVQCLVEQPWTERS